MTPPAPLQLPTDDEALGWVEARTEDGLARAREMVEGIKALDGPDALEVDADALHRRHRFLPGEPGEAVRSDPRDVGGHGP